MRRAGPAVACLVATLLLGSGTAEAQDAVRFFKTSCASCHTIGGGPLTGNDLKGATQRRSRAWLKTFISNPREVIDGGDQVARALVVQSRGSVMPTLGVPPEMVDALIELIAAESALPRSQFAGASTAAAGARVMTPADVAAGRALFMGERPFAEGGPACVSCHQVRDVVALGGGELGPDLTTIYARRGGRAPLAKLLTRPRGSTMRASYRGDALTADEVHQVVSYLKIAGALGGAAPPPSRLGLVAAGLVGTALALLVLEVAWRRRRRA